MMPEESTTPDLEEAVRGSVEAFNRHDFDAALQVYGPDAVWDASPMGISVFEGREAIRGFYEDWHGSYETFDQVIEEFRDLGGVTFAVLLQRARPRGSSGVVAFRYAAVGIWREGLAERFTVYADIDQARAAAERLAEQRG
jgi:ketosteroid isomerase-like protein